MPTYTLSAILSTFCNSKGEKLTLFNPAPVGGMNRLFIILFFIALPFIEYALIFQTPLADKFGFVTSIVVFIVFSSIIMVIIIYSTYKIKKNVVAKILPSWLYYFKDIDLNLVTGTGVSPYNDFYKHYAKVLNENFNEKKLHEYLIKSFQTMQEENSDLLEAMYRNKKTD